MSKLRPAVSERVATLSQEARFALAGDPRLLWPSLEYGSPPRCRDFLHFPDMDRVQQRYELGPQHEEEETGVCFPLAAFTCAVEQSLNCVLVLDPHFDGVGVDALAPALASSLAKDIRLLTASGKRRRETLRRMLEEYRNMDRPRSARTQVFWSAILDNSSFPFLHDRFAIVDGALWHFGSTVGGGYRGLTAASGPWSEDDTQGKRFFDDCWRRLHA